MYWKLKYLPFLHHEPCAVNDGKRLMAYLVDWFLSGLCLSLPMCLAWMMATKDLDQMEKVTVFRLASVIGDGPALAAAAAGLLLFLWYMVWVPWKVKPGQTPGKRMMGIAMARKDGNPLDLKTLLLRQVIGILLIEGTLYNGSGLLQDMLSLGTGLNFTGILLYVTLALTIVSLLAAFMAGSRRMIHDYLAGTVLVPVEEDRPDQMI